MIKNQAVDLKLLTTLFAFWMLLTWNPSIQNILVGLVISAVVMVITELTESHKGESVFSNLNLINFTIFVVRVIMDIFIASYEHVKKIRHNDAWSAIIYHDLTCEDVLLKTLIANAVTLTPGTISLEIQGNTLVVLALVRDVSEVDDFKNVIIPRYERIFGRKKR